MWGRIDRLPEREVPGDLNNLPGVRGRIVTSMAARGRGCEQDEQREYVVPKVSGRRRAMSTKPSPLGRPLECSRNPSERCVKPLAVLQSLAGWAGLFPAGASNIHCDRHRQNTSGAMNSDGIPHRHGLKKGVGSAPPNT